MNLVNRIQKNVKSLTLAGAVAVMPYLSGCATESTGGPNYARENEIGEQKAVGFLGLFSRNPLVNLAGRQMINDAQNKENNDAIRNTGRGNGNSEGVNQETGEDNSRNNSYESGEKREINEFGKIYTITAVNYIGNPNIAEIIEKNFLNKKREFSPGQQICIGCSTEVRVRDLKFRLYNEDGKVVTESNFSPEPPTLGGMVKVNGLYVPGKYFYTFSGKTYNGSLFGKNIGPEKIIINSEIVIK